MLARYLVDHIRELLTVEKLSSRQIVRRTGASRGAIMQIAAERNSDHPQPLLHADDDFETPLVPPKRCPECGGLIYPPCRLCQTRTFIRNHIGKIAHLQPIEQPIVVGLDLLPRHRARYEKVRQRRQEMEAAAR